MQDAFRRLRRGIWAVALSASLPAPAPAETRSYGAFFYDTRLPDALILQGEITDGLTYGLRKALREHDVKVVLLDSPGGAVFEGLEISAIIRDKGLSTLIPPDAICASACSFLFVAGVRRQAAGALGVHQFASANDMEPASEGDTQHVAAEILDFLREYDVPLIFMVRMLESGKSTIEVDQGAYERYNKALDDEASKLLLMQDEGAPDKNYYINEFGRMQVNAPWYGPEYHRLCTEVAWDDIHID